MAGHRELSGRRIVQEQVERPNAGSELGKGGGNGVLARCGDDLEVGASDAAEFVVEGGDAFVGGDGDGPFDAVVGDDHAIALECAEDGAGFWREVAGVEVGAEAESFAHAWEVGIGEGAGEVGGGSDIGSAGAFDGDTERVVDAAAFQFVPAHECGEEREAGGIGGSPAIGARAVAFEVEDGGLFCFPARVGFEEGIEFVEQTCGGVDDDGVAVAAEFLEVALDAIERGGAIFLAASEEGGPALDGSVVGDGIRAGIAFVGVVGDLYGDARLVLGDDDEGHVRVVAERFVVADRGDDFGGIGMERPVADWLVPWIVWGKDLELGENGVGGWCVEGDGSRDGVGLGAEGWRDDREEG